MRAIPCPKKSSSHPARFLLPLTLLFLHSQVRRPVVSPHLMSEPPDSVRLTGRVGPMTDPTPYRHRFPISIIEHAIWLYQRFKCTHFKSLLGTL